MNWAFDKRLLGAVAVLGLAGIPVLHAAPAQMRAMVETGFGGPEVLKLQMVDVPEPKAGEIRVRVYAAAINPNDWRFRQGERGDKDKVSIAGRDMAGVVDALGAGVTQWKIGDAVFGFKRPWGADAEYVAIEASAVFPKPKTFTYEQASGIGIAGLTGLRALADSGVKPGQRLVVIGAAGGVGSTVVQVAKARGIHVTAIATQAQDAYLREIGAEDVVHYEKEDVAAKVKNADVVINTAEGQSEAAIAYVKRGGTLFSTANDVPAVQAKCAAAGIHCSQTEGAVAEGPGVQMSELIHLVEMGQYKIHVDKVYPLEQTAAAQEANRMGHTTGKIVVSVTPRSAQR